MKEGGGAKLGQARKKCTKSQRWSASRAATWSEHDYSRAPLLQSGATSRGRIRRLDSGESLTKSVDFIIDTASGKHPLDVYVSLLKPNGVLVIVGAIGEIRLQSLDLIYGSKAIAASAVGGTKDIQEMLEFCAGNKIYPEIEIIPIEYINEALDRLVNRDVKYRFVIDIEKSLK